MFMANFSMIIRSLRKWSAIAISIPLHNNVFRIFAFSSDIYYTAAIRTLRALKERSCKESCGKIWWKSLKRLIPQFLQCLSSISEYGSYIEAARTDEMTPLSHLISAAIINASQTNQGAGLLYIDDAVITRHS